MALTSARNLALPALGMSAVLAGLVIPAYAAPTPTPSNPVPQAKAATTDGVTKQVSANQTVTMTLPVQAAAQARTQSGGRLATDSVVASVAQRAVDRYSMVGVTWSTSYKGHAHAEVRTRTNGAWTDWTELHAAEETPQDATRGGTSLTYVGDSDGVELRVLSKDGSVPDDMQLKLLRPQQQAEDSQLRSANTRAAQAGQPNIISRGQWGARSASCAGPDSTVRAVVVHHTEGSNNYAQSQSAGIVRGIQAYHMDSQGWCDIGYNFLVDRYGQVFEGRGGGINVPVHGAHAMSWNTTTSGISLMGSYTSSQPPQAQWDAAVSVAAWKLAAYYRSPYNRIEIGGISSDVISGHRQVVSTDCPGEAFYSRFDDFRNQVSARMGDYRTAIYNRWQNLGGEWGAPGRPYAGEAPNGAGRTTHFTNYDIYSSGSTRTVFTKGAIRDKYRSMGEAYSGLGLPTTDEICGLRGGGCFNDFQGGHIAWSPNSGVHPVWGVIRQKYGELGWDGGKLGFPTSDEVCGLRDGGCYQNFQGGHIAWSPSTGAHAVWGAIRGEYGALGWDRGVLGLPTSDEICGLHGGGCYQNYQGGHIAWTPTTGAHGVWGGIRAKYGQLGWDRGRLGWPTSDPRCTQAGCSQDFEGGTISNDGNTVTYR